MSEPYIYDTLNHDLFLDDFQASFLYPFSIVSLFRT